MFPPTCSDWQLYVSSFDLWGAGLETTTTTLHWAIGYMCANPDVQERVYTEILENVGPDTPVTMGHKQHLPYTNATILEFQRSANILVMNLPHTTTEDIVFEGYTIKKDTMIQGLISTVLWDGDHFPNPKTFDPDRFMPEGKQKYGEGKNPPEMAVPFGMGKRSCLGEPLARMELFLIFTTLIQNFKFEFATPKDEKDFNEVGPPKIAANFIRKASNYSVNISLR